MAVTIKDVAKKAQVAPSTVSRVIADHPKITQETKDKVRKVMEELGYHPNLLARNLVKKSSQTIGIVMKESSKHSVYDPFFPAALKGMSDLLHERNYSISLSTGETNEEIYGDVVKMVQGKNVDGIIMLYSRDDDPVLQHLLKQDFPFVMIGKPTTHINQIMYVDNDNVKAARNVTEYLLSIGHRRIAYVGGDPAFEVHKDRQQGYTEALTMAGIQEKTIFQAMITKESGEEVVEALLKMENRPTAIITTDELMSMSILSSLYAKGLRVPDDISLTSFMDSLISELSSPPLTTVDIQPFQLGYEAAKTLIDLLENPDMMKRNILVPTSIVERQSCKKITINKELL
ncbi:LacI family DNA-binding transcriptional regulator [Domibacillus epiphyticus]|uniref:LacI family transcriptional regulator n=1 Tax=Domibacillus epiphyticus TaxID=1714355 RepID=A0A1V2AB26_9BACI|nr:LacI family DNA-binding transcriptional regulator [Domibacillus epiphyticus]OMP68198.1 LacI family transcriptional regulator [Domibacillus epiphyticus]